MRTIYVVDEAENMRSMIRQYLTREGFRVQTFPSAEVLMLQLQSAFPDLFIFDASLSDQASMDIFTDIGRRSAMPVIFTTDSEEVSNRLREIELARCELMIKPFSHRELLSRVRAVFRHAPLPLLPEEIIETGNLRINPNDRHTSVSDTEVLLTPQEYELLLLLTQQPQRTFNRQEILDRIWGYDYVGEERAVDNLVKRLRKKLRENGSSKNVKTIWGCGYRFDE